MLTYPFITEKYSEPIITLVQAKEWLRVDIPGFTGEDDNIEALIASAVDYVESECNISLGVSDYEWDTNCLPSEIRDTFYIKSITSIEEKTDSGLSLIDSANYDFIRVSKRRSQICWKSPYSTTSSRFVVKFKAGLEVVPPRLLMAIRALITEWYDRPGDTVSEKRTFADKLLAPFVIMYAG